jgi:major coat protein
MKSMKLTKAEAKTMLGCMPEEGSGPAYPYGLTLYLNEDSLKKLGIAGLPDVGVKLNLAAMCTVTGTSSRQEQDGSAHQCVDLQITDMELTDPSAAPAGAAEKMYPSMKRAVNAQT